MIKTMSRVYLRNSTGVPVEFANEDGTERLLLSHGAYVALGEPSTINLTVETPQTSSVSHQ